MIMNGQLKIEIYDIQEFSLLCKSKCLNVYFPYAWKLMCPPVYFSTIFEANNTHIINSHICLNTSDADSHLETFDADYFCIRRYLNRQAKSSSYIALQHGSPHLLLPHLLHPPLSSFREGGGVER